MSVGLHSWLLSPENYCYDLSVVNYHSQNKYLSCLNLELECILIKILEKWNIYECPFIKGIKLKLFWKRIFEKFGKSGNWNEKCFCLLLERKFCGLIHMGFTQPRLDKAKLKSKVKSLTTFKCFHRIILWYNFWKDIIFLKPRWNSTQRYNSWSNSTQS